MRPSSAPQRKPFHGHSDELFVEAIFRRGEEPRPILKIPGIIDQSIAELVHLDHAIQLFEEHIEHSDAGFYAWSEHHRCAVDLKLTVERTVRAYRISKDHINCIQMAKRAGVAPGAWNQKAWNAQYAHILRLRWTALEALLGSPGLCTHELRQIVSKLKARSVPCGTVVERANWLYHGAPIHPQTINMATPEVIMSDVPVAQGGVMPSVEGQQQSMAAVQSDHPSAASHTAPLSNSPGQTQASVPVRQATNTPAQTPPFNLPKIPTPAPGIAPSPVLAQHAVNGHASSAPKFASPELPKPRTDQATANEFADTSNAIKRAKPSVVRHVVRDNWDRCLMGSEYHTAFMLNAILHQASEATLRTAVKDFGAKMVQTSKTAIFQHMTTRDIDELADQILSKASPAFLDKAVAQRLETATARNLVNALATAERLGYTIDDYVEEKGPNSEKETVTPDVRGLYKQVQQSSQHSSSATPVHGLPNGGQHISVGQQGISLLVCPTCTRPCSGPRALEYHQRKGVCRDAFDIAKVGKTACPHCGLNFGSPHGTKYHTKSQVCGEYDAQVEQAMWQALQEFARRAPSAPLTWSTAAVGPKTSGQMTPQGQATQSPRLPPSSSQTPVPMRTAANAHQATPKPPGAVEDHYAHLDPKTLKAWTEERLSIEEKYGVEIRSAMKLPEPHATDELIKIKNRYNTKQSVTRKKYGIRLKERRPVAEVDAERCRLLQTPNALEVWAEQERKERLFKSGNIQAVIDAGNATRPAKRARLDAGPDTGVPQYQQQPSPPKPVESPRKMAPLSEMGGLGSSAASAETVDPTAQAPQKTTPVRLYANRPKPSPLSQPQSRSAGAHDHPVSIASSDSEESDSTGNSSSDDDGEDIPAQ
ncbi:uncharacterized protein J7T54_005954 [Emericellopsis cladophorae]|uniref:Uncharacterized protein n=1 Tax=Emericellopsis cladophorae TaxID=2686198 RepID=A0A9P9Y973_9HYPO|nr:uncharacterized protein J7T54_005954 [Emericellopsis cladophorae]KAI6785620.1 hypothetical protein J7T54_005954 [Emericellopsis cladophorae]